MHIFGQKHDSEWMLILHVCCESKPLANKLALFIFKKAIIGQTCALQHVEGSPAPKWPKKSSNMPFQMWAPKMATKNVRGPLLCQRLVCPFCDTVETVG